MDSSNYKFELVKHLIDRKLNQQLLQLKNIQTIQKTPQIMSDIVEKKLDKEEKIFYNIMKKELQKDFSDFRYLAKGAQGYVMLAKEKSTNKRFAIKGCQVRDDEGNVEEKDLGDAKNEIEIVSKCKGSTYVSNLIKCIDLKENQFMYLVLTECQGTLQEVVDSTQDKKLNEISAIKYSRDIAEGLLHIHSKGYLVNDLKMDNILIDYNGNAVVSDFGCAQKLKKQSDYVYYEYEGNTYFQAPECVDRNSVNLYEDEYKKLGVVTQMNPSQRSEACSFGYIIYTLVQGKKQAFNFIYSKHKPLEYDGTFQSYKYSQQLQNIIDGLTKFIPRDRLSIKEALEQLNEIISIEININQKFQVYVSEQTQILSQKQLKEVEFIESFDKKYYPIVKDEDTFIKELVFEKDFSEEDNENLKQTEKADSQKNILQKEQQIINLTEELKVKNLQYENLQKSQQEEQEKLKKTIKEKENQISEIEVAQKENIQKKGQEIIDLTEKLQAKNKQYEDLQKSQQEEQEKLKQTVKDREDKILEIEDAYKKIIQKKEQEIIDLTEKLQAKNKQYENLQKSQQEEQEKLKQTVKDREDKILEIEDAYKKIIQKNEQEIIDLTGKLQNQNKEFENLQKLQKVEQEKFKKTVNERENQISELQATSKKNIQRKDEEIIDLKGKLQTKNQEVENLKTNLQNTQNLNISLQQEQDNLEINLQTKDEIIMQMEEDQQIQRDLIEQLKIQKLNLETQKSFFQIQKDNTEKIITQLEKGREHELNDKLLAVKIILLQ